VGYWGGGDRSAMRQYVGFKKAYDSVRREVLYNMFIESGVPMKIFFSLWRYSPNLGLGLPP
jgi:hypothetical protein